MTRVWAVAVSRSMADWASSVSAVMVQPFGGFSVGGHDGGLGAVAFDDDFVEVAGFGGVEGVEREIIDDEDVDGGQSADFGVDGVVEARGA